MAAQITRVAVCQVESHPALAVADMNYLREPFVPNDPNDRGTTLANLKRHSLRIADIQDNCESRYLDWHMKRIPPTQ